MHGLETIITRNQEQEVKELQGRKLALPVRRGRPRNVDMFHVIFLQQSHYYLDRALEAARNDRASSALKGLRRAKKSIEGAIRHARRILDHDV